jgi:hypothetical protein
MLLWGVIGVVCWMAPRLRAQTDVRTSSGSEAHVPGLAVADTTLEALRT